MIPRRGVIALGLACWVRPDIVLAAPKAPPGGRLAFAVMRKGQKIGQHLLTFEESGDGLTARAEVEMAVNLGPVAIFRYRHSQVERWDDGDFASLETRTIQNGRHSQVSAKRTDKGVEVIGPRGSAVLPAAARPLTHWNRQALGGPLFHPQKGRLMRLSIARQEAAPAVLADGRDTPATRVTLAGEASIDNWYDRSGSWAALRAKADDGSIVEYRRL